MYVCLNNNKYNPFHFFLFFLIIFVKQIFGPVQSILKFKDIDEVISRANATSYGLGSGVLTNDINKAMKVVNGIEAGTVW